MTIGERIKQRRLDLGLSADQVADRIGKNRATVYRYESNDIENFPLSILYPLAQVLNTTPAYLMGWEENVLPLDHKLPDGHDKVPTDNIIRIAGRDGSYRERQLTDEQMAALKAILDQMPDAPEGL